MDEDPRFLPIRKPDLEELIGKAEAQLRLAHDLLQFLVQRFVIPAPVDRRVRVGKKEARKWRKKCSSTSFHGLSKSLMLDLRRGRPHHSCRHDRRPAVVSMSWELFGRMIPSAIRHLTPGVTFIVSTGNYGAADPEYPAFSPNVVAVGRTSLTLNPDGSYNSETGWGYYSGSAGALIGSGGGISLYEPEPAYQQGVQSTGSRATPDVSLVADSATGVWIADPYNLEPSNPFEIVGGTSVSAPAWAGLFAIVNQGRAAADESSLNSVTPTDAQQPSNVAAERLQQHH